MNEIRHIVNALSLLLLILFAVLIFEKISSEEQKGKNNSVPIDYVNSTPSSAMSMGKSLFNANCASCHSITKELVGPALRGLEERGPWNDRKKLYEWVNNPSKFMANNSYVKTLNGKFGVVMTAFPNLREKDIDAIVEYINSYSSSPTSFAIR